MYETPLYDIAEFEGEEKWAVMYGSNRYLISSEGRVRFIEDDVCLTPVMSRHHAYVPGFAGAHNLAQLVALSFIPALEGLDPDVEIKVGYRDGNAYNCRLENLIVSVMSARQKG